MAVNETVTGQAERSNLVQRLTNLSVGASVIVDGELMRYTIEPTKGRVPCNVRGAQKLVLSGKLRGWLRLKKTGDGGYLVSENESTILAKGRLYHYEGRTVSGAVFVQSTEEVYIYERL